MFVEFIHFLLLLLLPRLFIKCGNPFFFCARLQQLSFMMQTTENGGQKETMAEKLINFNIWQD